MGEFFKPRRRKSGVVVLVMALLLTAGWVKSLTKRDFIEIDLSNATYRIGSMNGEFKLIYVAPAAGQRFWSSDELLDPKRDLWEGYQMEWRRDWAGFHFGVGTMPSLPNRTTALSFPYWFIVLPLTLLSARLLLSKQPPVKRPVEPQKDQR